MDNANVDKRIAKRVNSHERTASQY